MQNTKLNTAHYTKQHIINVAMQNATINSMQNSTTAQAYVLLTTTNARYAYKSKHLCVYTLEQLQAKQDYYDCDVQNTCTCITDNYLLTATKRTLQAEGFVLQNVVLQHVATKHYYITLEAYNLFWEMYSK